MHVITLEWSLQSRRRFEWNEKTGTFSSGIKKRFYNIRKIQISNFNSNHSWYQKKITLQSQLFFNKKIKSYSMWQHIGKVGSNRDWNEKFTCHWWPCSILVLLYCSLFFKMTNRQQKKNKRSTSYIKMRQMYQTYAHTCDFLIHTFFILALECDFWCISCAFFG